MKLNDQRMRSFFIAIEQQRDELDQVKDRENYQSF
jgi:hypothetical protein